MRTSPRCWAGYHAGKPEGCVTADCGCRCHRAPDAAAPAVETPSGSAPEVCGALASGHDICPGECEGCHVREVLA